ncbi:hypothetical protein J1N35_006747 [Gossypium stocksii]|uniref:Uncharacterized protein n=1 Tax=Gossypium stocksii TaxID=47602 RepID=A0A9D4AEL0_9ROSI|nr:hypothetical protein J1N35_006747 [Gossypium stocksii]
MVMEQDKGRIASFILAPSLRGRRWWMRYSRNREEKLSPSLHLASAAEVGALICCSLYSVNIFNLVTVSDALRTMLREEGWTALYTRLGPGLLMQVSHGAIQFTAYEELRRIMVDYEERKKKPKGASNLLVKNSFDYAVLGGSSKIAAILVTYPFQVCILIIGQQPSDEGIPRYTNSWHVVKETAWFEGFHGFYKGINPNLLRHVPASSITFIVYENVLKFLKSTENRDLQAITS